MLLLFFCFLVMPSAIANVVLEPYAGYIVDGDAKANKDVSGSNKDYTNSYSGVTVGGRIGVRYQYLIFGVGYSMAKFDMRYNSTADNGNTETFHDQYRAKYKSLFGGFTFSSAFKLIGNYYQEVSFEDRDPVLLQNGSEVLGGAEGATQTGDKFYGHGYGVLLSYTGYKGLGIDIEYRKLKMSKFKDVRNENYGDVSNTMAIGSGAVFTKYSSTEIVLTLGFSFEFFSWREGPRH